MAEKKQDKYDLSGIWQGLGNAIVPVLKDNWLRVIVGYFVEDEAETSHLQIFVLNADADDYEDLTLASWDHTDYDDAILNAQDICGQLRTSLRETSPWTSLTFVLERNGTYRVEFGYEPIKDYSSMFLLDWQSRYLTPQEL